MTMTLTSRRGSVDGSRRTLYDALIPLHVCVRDPEKVEVPPRAD